MLAIVFSGYHNKFHKDEYHKEHKFYDDFHKGGHHKKHGDFQGHHEKKEGAHKKGGHHTSAYEEDHKGKKGHHDKGHFDDEHKGHKGSKGHEEHHAHKEEFGKKGGAEGGKKWGYKKAGGHWSNTRPTSYWWLLPRNFYGVVGIGLVFHRA